MKKLIYMAIGIFLIAGCTKPLSETELEEYQLQLIKKGSHYCDNHNITEMLSFTSPIFAVSVKIDTSMLVTNEGSFQSKLVGFYEDNIHTNSARVSFHTTTQTINNIQYDSLELKAYVYSDGNRNIKENYLLQKYSRADLLEMLAADSAVDISIELTTNQYIFRINNELKAKVKRESSMSIEDTKCLSFFYYGGPDSIPAPKDMKIWVKYDAIML